MTPKPKNDRFEDVDERAAQLEHADQLITELMARVDALEVELAGYWLADAADVNRRKAGETCPGRSPRRRVTAHYVLHSVLREGDD